MDYLLKKSDGSVTNLGGTVSRLQLPEQTGGDVVFPGDTRPVDLGDYVLVKAIEVTQEVTSGKKRGDTTVVGDKDKETVTVTYTAVDQTNDEKAVAYKSARAEAYAALGDQLDQLFHDMTNDKGDKSGDWYKAVAKVKSDFPKPE